MRTIHTASFEGANIQLILQPPNIILKFKKTAKVIVFSGFLNSM